MKIYIFYLLIALSFHSCEDVIDVELNDAQPRLTIDASINWFKGTVGNEQSIKLTQSTSYFSETIPPATGAVVFITDSENNVFNFTESGNTGIYETSAFIPVMDRTYILTVVYNGETYIAHETMTAVSEIEEIEQLDDGGFTGEEIELKAYYTDPANIENYYFFEFISDIAAIPSLDVYNDEFTDGNTVFAYYSEEDLESNDIVYIRNYGVSERFYEFMFILLQQNGEEGGGPFETQPATVRGNCINTTNQENYPFGYFRVSEADQVIYTVQ
ncbi:MAG: hypothetical protein BM564_07055 [Bacteroidetes bacterium MedPE-SWsnd-G2]|nr:MAG: hypothetical protein BM564_07055 [Bacteroidetes bacterium MedPE-SWsnd-G2]